jgi:hypothetical protein
MVLRCDLAGPIIGHVGDGNFHVFYPIDEKQPEQLNKIKEVTKKMSQ